MEPIPTCGPHTFIEAERPGYIRYWRDFDNRRWEIHGYCDNRGECMVGAVLDGETITCEADITRLIQEGRIDGSLDMPVFPEQKNCCLKAGLLRAVELQPGPYQPD